MAQKKLVRFAAIKTYPHVLEYPQDMPGKWNEFFKNNNPVTLELACGRGEYAVGLARLYPGRNFIGVDIKGNRIYVGARQVLNEGLANAAFLRTHIDKIATYFEKGEVENIWITFPDPQLRTSRAKKRLTHPHFLRLYQQILSPEGFIHLKTDSPALFEFTKVVINMYGLKLVEENDNIYKETGIAADLAIKTHYELLDIAQSNKIHYLKFALPEGRLPALDDKLQELIKINERTDENSDEENNQG